MTLDEAIEHCEDVVKTKFQDRTLKSDECAKEHLQLADWFKELKKHREGDKS